eukprot:NODE_1540_length_1380_cov_11.859504_g1281_i0.p3 GENE.NODE_1540_length_1380_cov_11.859504_g1281_i0~~NODE_1540_length_1380_cov_11.859504_g1281_i0.p3  ORF type:complete len:113 (-),score=11.85 NODE_1540_length_1380_cov_11.859504_g1281_i0:116-454(-)
MQYSCYQPLNDCPGGGLQTSHAPGTPADIVAVLAFPGGGLSPVLGIVGGITLVAVATARDRPMVAEVVPRLEPCPFDTSRAGPTASAQEAPATMAPPGQAQGPHTTQDTSDS